MRTAYLWVAGEGEACQDALENLLENIAMKWWCLEMLHVLLFIFSVPCCFCPFPDSIPLIAKVVKFGLAADDTYQLIHSQRKLFCCATVTV